MIPEHPRVRLARSRRRHLDDDFFRLKLLANLRIQQHLQVDHQLRNRLWELKLRSVDSRVKNENGDPEGNDPDVGDPKDNDNPEVGVASTLANLEKISTTMEKILWDLNSIATRIRSGDEGEVRPDWPRLLLKADDVVEAKDHLGDAIGIRLGSAADDDDDDEDDVNVERLEPRTPSALKADEAMRTLDCLDDGDWEDSLMAVQTVGASSARVGTKRPTPGITKKPRFASAPFSTPRRRKGLSATSNSSSAQMSIFSLSPSPVGGGVKSLRPPFADDSSAVLTTCSINSEWEGGRADGLVDDSFFGIHSRLSSVWRETAEESRARFEAERTILSEEISGVDADDVSLTSGYGTSLFLSLHDSVLDSPSSDACSIASGEALSGAGRRGSSSRPIEGASMKEDNLYLESRAKVDERLAEEAATSAAAEAYRRLPGLKYFAPRHHEAIARRASRCSLFSVFMQKRRDSVLFNYIDPFSVKGQHLVLKMLLLVEPTIAGCEEEMLSALKRNLALLANLRKKAEGGVVAVG